jgi:hypothetical protein
MKCKEVTSETFAMFVNGKYQNMKARPTIMKDEAAVVTRSGFQWVISKKAVVGSHAAPDAPGARKPFADYLVKSKAVPIEEADAAEAAE